MVFITEGFFEVAIESWPEWDLNPRPLKQKRKKIIIYIYIYIYIYIWLVQVKYLSRHYIIYHNCKVPGENFLLLTSRID